MKTNYTPANNSKRIIGLVIDAAISFVLALLFNSFVAQKFIAPSFGADEMKHDAFSFVYDSGLFDNAPDAEGNFNYASLQLYNFEASPKDDQTDYGYVYYLDKTWNYYTNFLRIDSRVEHLDGLVSEIDYASYFYADILKFSEPDLAKTYASDETPDSGNKYLTYALNDAGNIDLSKKPVVRNEIVKEDGTLSDANAVGLLQIFFNTSSNEYTGIYYEAAYKTSQMPYFASINDKLTKLNWVCFVAMYVPVALIIYYIIPITNKRGKSLGKLVAKTSVANVNGMYMNPVQRFLRPVVLTAFAMAMLIPNNLFGIVAWAALCGIDYAIAYILKSDRCGHDLLFKTVVIEDGAKLFETKEEADKFASSIEAEEKEIERMIYDNSGVNLHVED